MLSRRSAYFEDFEVGQEVTTPGRTLTEADVVAFAGISGDYNRLHTDAVYASSGAYGQRIAHGLLVLAITSGLVTRLGLLEESVLAFRELTCKFKKPVFIGDTIYARAQVTDVKALRRVGGGLVQLGIRLYNQRKQVVQIGTWTVLVQSRRG